MIRQSTTTWLDRFPVEVRRYYGLLASLEANYRLFARSSDFPGGEPYIPSLNPLSRIFPGAHQVQAVNGTVAALGTQFGQRRLYVQMVDVFQMSDFRHGQA
jgi:hypothetical protein